MEKLETPLTEAGMLASLSNNLNVELFLSFIVAALLLSVIVIVIVKIINLYGLQNILKGYKMEKLKTPIIVLAGLSSLVAMLFGLSNNWYVAYLISNITIALFWLIAFIQKK